MVQQNLLNMLFEPDQVIILKIIKVSLLFSSQKIMRHSESKTLPWQHLTTMVTDKIYKMTFKCVKLKSERFNILRRFELWSKTLMGLDSAGRIKLRVTLVASTMNRVFFR